MRKIILISILLLNPVFSAVMQTELKQDLWQLIGFKGNHLAESSVLYKEDITREIIDIADNNTTYLVKENDKDNSGLAYIRPDYTLSTKFITSTTQLKSSIGIFAIENALSPSGKTTLKPNINSAIRLKIKDAKLYDANMPRYRMYIKGRNSPAIRIDYQANYEGHPFRIKFGNENEDYMAVFDYSSTFTNAVSPQEFSNSNIDASAYSSVIKDVVDFNSSDNNITQMLYQNKFTSKDLLDYDTHLGYSVTAYKFENGVWKTFNSKNNANSNDFDKFDIAKGYWVKIENSVSFTQMALISKASDSISNDSYNNIKDGWNILTFNDSYLRYSPTSVFIPMDLISAPGPGVSIYSKSNAKANDRDTIFLTNIYPDSANASRIINATSQSKQDLYGITHKIRSIPAIKVDVEGNETVGIIVLSDELFELNTSGTNLSPITTIAGERIKKLTNNNYGSVYGEYLNFMEINDLSGSDINATISIKMPKYSSSYKISANLNDDNNTEVLVRSLKALRQSAIKTGETTPSTRVAGYLTKLNFNLDDDYTKEGNMSHMLLASGSRYYISDNTYNKVYKFNKNGKFKISSSSNSVDVDSGNSESVLDLITTINAQTKQTNIIATDLGLNSDGDAQFTISSTSKGLDLLENDTLNLFEDISLTASDISNANFTRGSVTAVHDFLSVLNAVVLNREVVSGTGGAESVFGTIPTDGTDTTLTEADVLTRPSPVLILGNLHIAGSLDMSGGTDKIVEIRGNLTLGGNLVIGDGVTVIVRGNISAGANIVINDGGTLLVKGNGEVDGHLEINSNGVVKSEGTFTVVRTPHPPSDPILRAGAVFIPGEIITDTFTTATTTVTLLDEGVDGVPAGLFDLRGRPFPSLTTDLKSNPSPTLDFPISGGIIELFYDKKKEIRTIMTLEHSSSNKPFWKLTDLTKNIDTLYGNSYDSDDLFNNDYQGIFHLHANKAYWVNVGTPSNLAQRPNSLQATIDASNSKITLQSYTHFSNTFNKGISTTQNHINHRLNIKFKDTFISPNEEEKDYYNVVAIIKGQRHYLKRNGGYFSLDINDNDMPLLEKIVNKDNIQEKDEPIILEIYDGTGLTFKEKDSSSRFKIKYFKPPTPTFTWNEDNDLIIDDYSQKDIDNNISTLELYAKSVSDIKSERSKALLTENNLSKNKDNILKWEYGNDKNLYGGLSAIRAIIKKQDYDKEVSFYSDMRAFLYAPIKKGHKLEANTTYKISNLPYSYISNKKLTKDNGVQISYIHSNKDIGKIAISYYPKGKEGIKSLQGTGFGASRNMFLRVNTGATKKEVIASIKYIPEYTGEIFYVYFDNKLYQGRFSNSDKYSNDSDAYNLESATISTDTFINGSGTQASNDGGRFVDGGGQRI